MRVVRESGLGSAALAARDGGASFLVGFALALGLALVPLLLAGGDGELAFDAAVAEVEPDGDERGALCPEWRR